MSDQPAFLPDPETGEWPPIDLGPVLRPILPPPGSWRPHEWLTGDPGSGMTLPRTLSQAHARERKPLELIEAVTLAERPVWPIYAMYGALLAVFALAAALRWWV